MDILDLLLDRAANFIPVLLSLTVHEWAHAWTAWRLGDDTAKMLGRMSLNPIDHIDPVGTLLLPLLGIPFGWAKPVPINPIRFNDTVSMPMGILLTAAAGPVSNFILAAASSGALFALTTFAVPSSSSVVHSDWGPALTQFLQSMIIINVVLACFNLLPIPPLDGSRIVDGLIPSRLQPFWSNLSSFGPLLLVAVILVPGFLGFRLMAWPLEWANELVAHVMRR